MNILVTQPNSEYASKQINVFLDNKYVGAISYGESLMAKSDEAMCVVKVTCGFHSAAVNMSADGEIQVRWSLNGPLELIKK